MTQPLLFTLMALASYRLWHLAALDDLPVVAAPRRWLYDAVAGRFGHGWADGLTCAWCTGTWITVAVIAVTAQATSVTLPVLQAAAAAAAVGLLSGWER